MSGQRWVGSWVAAPRRATPDELPPRPFTRDGHAFAGCTLRQTVRVTVGGARLRLRLSNVYGSSALAVGSAAVARPAGGRAGISAVEPASARPVRFDGRRSVRVPAGSWVESDPLDFAVAARSNVTVSISLTGGIPAGGVTSHPGSRTTSYLLAGDHVAEPDLPGAVAVDHWYFLGGLRVPAGSAVAAVLIGDSLTDGRGSTTNHNDRWPDRLVDRLHADPGTSGLAVLNLAAGGTRLLDEDPGFIQEALSLGPVRWVVVFKGVNDIGTAAAEEVAQRRLVSDLVGAYDRIITLIRASGVRVYGATLLPFGGNESYDDPAGHRERARGRVNEWIRGAGRFDGVLDFDRVVCDPADPRRLAATFDCGDHLHLSPAGYRALAGSVPTRLFLTG